MNLHFQSYFFRHFFEEPRTVFFSESLGHTTVSMDDNNEKRQACDFSSAPEKYAAEIEELQNALEVQKVRLGDLQNSVNNSLLEMGNVHTNQELDTVLEGMEKNPSDISPLEKFLEEIRSAKKADPFADDFFSEAYYSLPDYDAQMQKVQALIFLLSRGKECGVNLEDFRTARKNSEEYLEKTVKPNMTKGENPQQYMEKILAEKNISFSPELQEKIRGATVMMYRKDEFNGATGFFVSPNVILTNMHVISSTSDSNLTDDQVGRMMHHQNISAFNIDGQNFTVAKMEKIAGEDMALVTVKENNSHFFSIAQKEPEKGEELYHLGFGDDREWFYAFQEVMFPHSFLDIQKFQYQGHAGNKTDATDWSGFFGKARGGDSGGPILNQDGEIVSILHSGDTSNLIEHLLSSFYLSAKGMQYGEKLSDIQSLSSGVA